MKHSAHGFRGRLRGTILMSGLPAGLIAGLSPSYAQTTVQAAPTTTSPNLDLGSVLTQGTTGNYAHQTGAAPYEAPSVAPLNSLQPTSVVNQHTIDANFTGTQSYADVLKLTPSVSSAD